MVHNIFTGIRYGADGSKLRFKEQIRLLRSRIHARLNRKVTGLRHVERELYGSGITLKNLAIVYKDQPLAAEYMYEMLMDNTRVLKPVYQEMLNLYRNGRYEEAFAVFGERTGTRSGKHFAMVLSKLDSINPAELIEQMEVFQDMMSEERMTEATKEVQRKSILTTTWATAAIFALLINFTVVVVFMDKLNTLQELF